MIHLKLISLNILLVSAWIISAQAPVIQAVNPVATSVEQFGKFEASLDIRASWSNPYDYDEIAVTAVFTGPDNRPITVEGFFMQDHTLNLPQGSITPFNTGVFKIRFSPNQPGSWRYAITCTTAAGSTSFPEQTFTCLAASSPGNQGFIRRQGAGSNYLVFDQGGQFIPIGQNVAWQNGNPYVDYSSWLTKMSENNSNFFRLWQAHWGLGIEWRSGSSGFSGLRRYRQSNAFYLDWLFDFCAEKNIYVMFCIQHHGQVSTTVNPNWSDSPYNAANGGPCVNTWDFFTNTAAKNHVKNRLRYILARWGYSRNIMSWELFNEVDWTDQFAQRRTEVAGWHAEMAAFLRSRDPNMHLITTSYAYDQFDPAVWNQPDVDITQTHYYIESPNLERAIARGTQQYLDDFKKPTLNGEFGLGGSSSGLAALDPNGIHIHNALWGSLFSGGLGAGLSWWWDSYIHPRNLYYHFAPIGALSKLIPFHQGRYQASTARTRGAGGDLILTPSLGWGALASTDLTITENGTLTPSGAVLGSYLYGSVWNTQFKRAPSFKVSYPQAGKFIVATGGQTGTSPKITIWLNGTILLDQNAGINQIYQINVPAGQHTIRVDNTGTDWITIKSYTFTGIGSAIDAYVLLSDSKAGAAGWVLNNSYNYEFVRSRGLPAQINGAELLLDQIANGAYQVQWYNCLSGAVVKTELATAANNVLTLPIPGFTWDLAFTVSSQTVSAREAVQDLRFEVFPNPISNGVLHLRFHLEQHSRVHITLLDAAGREVRTLSTQQLLPGFQTVEAGIPSGLPGGIYWLKIVSERLVGVKPVIIRQKQ